MVIVIKFRQGRQEPWDVVSLHDLPKDLKRILSIQVRELIHEIEDCENDLKTKNFVLLEACLKAS